MKNNDYDLGSRYKARLIRLFTPVGMSFLLVYAYVSYLDPRTHWFSYLLLTIFVILSLNLFLVNRSETLTFSSNLIASLGIPILIPWLFLGGPLGQGIFWSPVYITWCFLLAGRRWSAVWLSILYASYALLAVLDANQVLNIAYTPLEMLQVFFMSAFNYALLLAYSAQSETFEKLAYRALDKIQKDAK